MSVESGGDAQVIEIDGAGPGVPVAKARLIGVDDKQSRVAGDRDDRGLFTGSGALEPPHDPAYLDAKVEQSSSLRPNIDTMSANIDAFGHRFEPAIDLDAEDAVKQVSDALFERAINDGESEPADPTEAEVEAEIERLRRLLRVERARLRSFFDHCGLDSEQRPISFPKLRVLTRRDMEGNGNAYWEVLRNMRGEPARLVYMTSNLVRLMPLDKTVTTTHEWERLSAVHAVRVPIRRTFRRYVQIDETTANWRYFKAFGDPRVMSATSGRYYETIDALRSTEPGARAATEVIHWRLDNPSSPYGQPRWIGALPEVLGTRAAAEVNVLFFDHKSVPPMAILVSGGVLAKGAEESIRKYIENNIKGRSNFHKILLIEAESDGKTGTACRVEIKPLMEAIQQDALFQNYDQQGRLKIGGMFRIPPLLRGDTRDFNRATAESARLMAEEQVFGPERDEFDFAMDRLLLPELGVFAHRFRSMSPVTRDPERMAKNIDLIARNGGLLPKDVRRLAQDVFNVRLPDFTQDWANMPLVLALAGIQTGTGIDGGVGAADLGGGEMASVDAEAERMLGVQQRLEAAKAALAARRVEIAREYAAGGGDVVEVPADEFRSWFEDGGTTAPDALKG